MENIQTRKYNTDQCDKFTKDMARKIVDMENSFDYSMRFHYIDQLVTDYVSEKGKEFIEMFEYIMKNQKEDYDTYGDIDESVHKLKVTGSHPGQEYWKDYDFTSQALYIRDNPTCSNENQWVIVKTIKSIKPSSTEGLSDSFIERMKTVSYHVRLVDKQPKKLILNKILKYGDLRDNGYVVTFEKRTSVSDDSPFEVKDRREMLYGSKRFIHLMRNMYSIYAELNPDAKIF